MKHHNSTHSGAVSLFIVVFTVLLLTVVTVSFVRIMLADQEQAATTDLSQSAYDSAQSGVEDAKRALLLYQTECSSGDAARCAAASIAPIASQQCNEALSQAVGRDVSGQEVLIRQDAGDETLQQAYTCVKVSLQTDDVVGSNRPDGSKVIPLISTAAFNIIQLEWFSGKNVSGTSIDKPIDLQLPGNTPLLRQSPTPGAWPVNRPSVMRTQFMQVNPAGFTLPDFDSSANGQNSLSLFLYPTGVSGTPRSVTDTLSFTLRDIRKTPVGTPDPVICSGNVGAGGYACTVRLTLPTSVPAGSRTAFLRVGTIYNTADFRVSLYSGTAPVQFDNVQPLIDSTGRASDIFRRVQTRVEFTDFPYPDAAVDVTGNLCKNFIVTDVTTDYRNTCTP